MKHIQLAGFSGTCFEQLQELPDAPKKLYCKGPHQLYKNLLKITIVGSRSPSIYSQQVVKQFLKELAGYPVCIISGLAFGVDALAHKEALKNNIKTIAIPGSSIDTETIYPSANRSLAQNILNKDGLLVSEYEPKTKAAKWTFPQRNRIMAGMSDLVIIIEAREKSGTLITARLATEYNKTIAVIPHRIDDKNAVGSNKLIRDGAFPLLETEDILDILGLEKEESQKNNIELTKKEAIIINLLSQPIEKEELIKKSTLTYHEAIITLSQLQLKGAIAEEYGLIRRI